MTDIEKELRDQMACVKKENEALRDRIKNLEKELKCEMEESSALQDQILRLEGEVEAFQYCIQHHH